MQKCSLVPGLPPQLSSLAVRITMRSVIRTALGTASDDSCVRGGLHGYKATGHAREKPICRFAHTKLHGDLEIIFLEKKKLSFLLYPMRPGLRNKEFTYHGLTALSSPRSNETKNGGRARERG